MTHHMEALMHFMVKKNWLYYSVIADANPYGYSFVKLLKKSYRLYDMCIAVISSVQSDVDFRRLLLYHRKHFDVNVIVAFVRFSSVQKLSKAVKDSDLEGSIIIIGCDFFFYDLYFGNLAKGFLSLGPTASQVAGLKKHLMELDDVTLHDPWLKSVYATVYKCTHTLCAQHFLHDDNLLNALPLGDVFDVVRIYASALRSLLDKACHGKYNQEAVSCFRENRHKMISYIEEVKSFTDQSSYLFNKDRLRVTDISIFQSVESDTGSRVVEISRFDYYTKTTSLVRGIDLEGFSVPEDVFEASYRCQPVCPGDASHSFYTRCCWTCAQCSFYEIVADNRSHCEKCPTLYWPSIKDGKKSTCEAIKLTYINFSLLSSQFLVFLSLALLGVAAAVQYAYHSKRFFLRIRKTHYIISVCKISSIASGYFAIPLLVYQPKTFTCIVGLGLFELSFISLYLCLAIKTFDLYYCSRTISGDPMTIAHLREAERSAAIVCTIFEASMTLLV